MIDYADLMTKATMLRNEMGEDSNSPIDIFAISQRIKGLTIVYYPMGENLSGMCIKGHEGNNVVAINSEMTIGRQRFSLAHEFYHLYYDDNMISICSKKLGEGKDIEKSADMFASYFLMPDAGLLMFASKLANDHQDNKLTFDDIIRIEQYYGVSHQTAIYRLLHTPYLEKRKANTYLNTSVRKRAELLGFSSELYKPLPVNKQYKTYGNYIDKVEQLYSKGLISNGKYEELLLDAFRSDLVYGDEEEGGDVID